MKIKKVLYIFLAVIIINIYLNNASAEVNLNIESSNIINALFNLDVEIKGTDLIAGYRVNISFDKTQVKIAKISTNIEDCFYSDLNSSNNNGFIKLIYLDLSGKGKNLNNLKMANIQFKVTANEVSETTISTDSIFSDNSLNIVTGNQNINEVIMLNSLSGMNIHLKKSDQDFDPSFSIKLSASGNGKISGSQVKLIFDSTKLQILKIIPSKGIFTTESLKKVNTDSYLTIASLDISNGPMLLDKSPLLATISFKIIDEGITSIEIDKKFTSAYDNEMDNVPITSETLQLDLPKIHSIINFSLEGPEKVQLNEEFSYILNMKSIQNTIISGIQTKLNFDNSKLIITNLTSNSDFNILSSTIEKANERGIANFVYTDFTGNGYKFTTNSSSDLALISFRAINRGSAKLIIDESSIVSDIMMNEISGNKDYKIIKIGTAIIGNVTARIAGYDELVIPNATVVLKSNDDDKQYVIKTDKNGDFEFIEIAAGNYTLIIDAPDLGSFKTEFYYDATDFYNVEIPKLESVCKNDIDINLDKKIGLEEAIYALKITAGEVMYSKKSAYNIQLSNMNDFQNKYFDKTLIEITDMPPYGNRIKDVEGTINHNEPGLFKIVVYTYFENWHLKGGINNQYIFIDEAGKWSCDITTGAYDHKASKIAIFLIPYNLNMLLKDMFEDLPDYLYINCIDHIIINRMK